MTPDMAFECLLVSQDPAVYCTMDRILHNFSIHTNVCPDYSKAAYYLKYGGTDLFVIDLESENSSELIYEIFKSSMHQKPTVLAVSETDCALPGVHIILRKPVTTESGTKSMKAAYSRMLRDYRKHTRFALMTPVLATDENDRTLSITVTNIGEGGVGFICKERLEVGNIVSFRVPLMGLGTAISIKARVLWSRGEYNAVGCEFAHVPPGDLHDLNAWLESKYRFKRPLIPV